MKSSAFTLGSLAASGVSYILVSTVYSSLLGRAIPFIAFGICGGLALTVVGVIWTFFEGRSKKTHELQSKGLKNEAMRLVPWFLIPFLGLLGFTWIFSQ